MRILILPLITLLDQEKNGRTRRLRVAIMEDERFIVEIVMEVRFALILESRFVVLLIQGQCKDCKGKNICPHGKQKPLYVVDP